MPIVRSKFGGSEVKVDNFTRKYTIVNRQKPKNPRTHLISLKWGIFAKERTNY